MSDLLIVKTGSTHDAICQRFGDFDHWFRQQLGAGFQTVDATCEELPEAAGQLKGVVITGSPAMVTDKAPWSERTAGWLQALVSHNVPVLGVCYGHQLLAHALGGLVGFREQGRESGTFTVSLTRAGREDRLFGQLPESFEAHLTHAQSVLRLPEGATLLARSSHESHQAFRVGRHAWGVQFHPEFNAEIMKAYLEIQAPALREEGQVPEDLLARVADTNVAGSLLARFADYVCHLSDGDQRSGC